jgi:hypothetical protein
MILSAALGSSGVSTAAMFEFERKAELGQQSVCRIRGWCRSGCLRSLGDSAGRLFSGEAYRSSIHAWHHATIRPGKERFDSRPGTSVRLFCTGRASTAFGNCLKRFGDRLAFPIHFFLAAVAFLISAAAVFANLGTRQAIPRIMANLKRHPGKWLRSAARRMVKVTIKDWKEWKRAHG